MQLLSIGSADRIRPPIVSRASTSRRGKDAGNAEFLATPAMCSFGFVPGVGDQRGDRLPGNRFGDGLSELAVVGCRPARDNGGQEQMRVRVADRRKLRIAVFVVAAVLFAASRIVRRYVAALQAGGIDSRLGWAGADQSLLSGETNCRIKESASAPFFRRRPSAMQSVA